MRINLLGTERIMTLIMSIQQQACSERTQEFHYNFAHISVR